MGSKKKRSLVKSFLSSRDPNIVMLQVTKREKWDRCFLVSVWRGRVRDWVVLQVCGASGGVVII